MANNQSDKRHKLDWLNQSSFERRQASRSFVIQQIKAFIIRVSFISVVLGHSSLPIPLAG